MGSRIGCLSWGVVLSILSIQTASAQFLSGDCKIFSRDSASAPQQVKAYLKKTEDAYVEICSFDAQTQYFAASKPLTEDSLCRFSMFELIPNRAKGKGVLERQKAETIYFAPKVLPCPRPSIGSYIASRGISAPAFSQLIGYWREVNSSIESFDRAFSSEPEAVISSPQFLRFRASFKRDSSALSIREIKPINDLGVWKQFSITISDPDNRSRSYVVDVSLWFGFYYRISGFSVLVV